MIYANTMNRKYLYIPILLFLMYNMGCTSSSQGLDEFFEQKMEDAHIAGLQVAYISNGELKWTGSYGLANYNTKETVTDSTLFMIASLSKPVTALALMRLYDKGLLALDEDINTYLPFHIRNPNFPEKKITLRMLLTHTSSLIDSEIVYSLYTLDQGGGDSPIALGAFIQEYFLANGTYYSENNFLNIAPGEELVYSNTGYALAGYLIEAITGETFATYMEYEIFMPLKMDNAFWFLENIKNNSIARPHEYQGMDENSEYDVLNHYGYPSYPDGQLRTTVTDYARIVNIFINEGKSGDSQFLKKETIDTFLSIQIPEAAEYQAIAWNYNEFDHWLYYLLMPRLPSHTGVDPGVATVVSFDPVKKTGAIIFANAVPIDFWGQKIFYQEMMKKLLTEAENEK